MSLKRSSRNDRARRISIFRPTRALLVGVGTAASGILGAVSQVVTGQTALALATTVGGVLLTAVVTAMTVDSIEPRARPDIGMATASNHGNSPAPLATFHDRNDEISVLAAALGGSPPKVVTLYGIGGVGKSSLAATYLARHTASDEPSWWINASERHSMVAGIDLLAHRLGISRHGTAVEILHRALSHLGDKQWILVLDDAPSADAVRWILQGLGRHKVLVTSRNPNWRATSTMLEVRPFDEAVARDFVLQGTNSADEHAATELARALGGLPLALDLAIGHSNESGATLERLGRVYRRDPASMLRIRGRWSSTAKGVPMPWDESVRTVARRDRRTFDLLHFLSFAQPDQPIPRVFVEQSSRFLPRRLGRLVQMPQDLDQAIARLYRMGLVQIPTPGMLSMHIIIKSAVLDAATRRYRRWRHPAWSTSQWTCAWLESLAAGLATDDHTFQDWMTSDILAIHCRLLLSAETTHHDKSRAAIKAAYMLARYLLDRGGLQEAYEYASAARSWAAGSLPKDHDDSLSANWIYAWVLHVRQDYDEAISVLEEVVRARTEVDGSDALSTLMAANSLAGALCDRGRPGDVDRAIALHERVLAAHRSAAREDHPLYVISLHNLASAHLKVGDLERSFAEYNEVLTRQRARYGAQHPRPLIVQYRLAETLEKLGREREALELASDTLADREQLLGIVHPDALASRIQVAGLLRQTGRSEQAVGHVEAALKAATTIYGLDHPVTRRLASDLGDLRPPS